ncbi:MAG: AMP-binding protein [Oscillospiraceae bacterium]|nr:AMP-binding protein [Oscillospiraceae bacterium]
MKQKINKKYVDERLKLLGQTEQDFAALYRLTFSLGGAVMAETNDGLRVHRHTYAQAAERCDAAAAALSRRIGPTHGEVGLEMENCGEWIVAFWAILRSGNKPLLINCRHSRELSNSILRTLEVRYVVALSPGALEAEYLPFRELNCPEPFEEVWEDEIALSTSATTMKQTICFYHGAQICAQLHNSSSIIRACPRMYSSYHGQIKQLAFLPFYHVFGLFAVYFWFSFFGGVMVFLRDMAPDTILRTVRRHEVTHIFAVPMLWHSVEKQIDRRISRADEKTRTRFQKGLALSERLQNAFPRLGPALAQRLLGEVNEKVFGPSVRFCISGGSYLRPSALELLNGLGYCLHNGFGMSETGITSVELRKRPRERNRNSIGRPFASVEYRLSPEGVCQIRGASISPLRMVDGQRLPVTDWLETGDIMECRDGYYYIKGRKGDVVIGENGENINPDLIEQRFTLPDALRFSVLGLPDGKGAETLSIVVQLNPWLPARRAEALMQQVYEANRDLDLSMQIRRFYITHEAIAAETAIKVSRVWLRRAIDEGRVHLCSFADYSARTAGTTEADSPLATRVRELVAEVLDLEPEAVGPDAHWIFDLGASSLQYFEILTGLGEEFALSRPSEQEQYRYTVREICRYIEEQL